MMRNRCNNPNCAQYADYGGRGITVCDRWDSFELFLQDMGERPGLDLSIEREDNDGNYEPSNCYWATRIQQRANRRPPKFLKLIKRHGNNPMRYISRKRGTKNFVLQMQLKPGVLERHHSQDLEKLLQIRSDLEMERFMYHTLLGD
jgi:hypothetical protein